MKEKLEVTSVFIHTADLNHTTKAFSVSSNWTALVNMEFSAQYKEEGEKELPLTPYFANLDNNEVFYKSEFSFLTFIVSPLYKFANIF